jgi:hypothetical protein
MRRAYYDFRLALHEKGKSIMDETAPPSPSRLCLRINYWTDYVGTFDPRKVVGLVKRSFPETVIDSTDHQDVRLRRELEHFATIAEPQRETMLGQALRNAQDNGPTFRFEIPIPGGSPIKGTARRYSISFDIPAGSPATMRERLESFLNGLQLGQPEWWGKP